MSELVSGFYPFWFWNGDLTTEEIRWQIAEMARQGVRGFFIHSRQGLRQPYLSETFLDRVGDAIEAAKVHGLIVHLYDEYPYPSGAAGGAVVLGEPGYHATELRQEHFDAPGGLVSRELPSGKLLCCTAYPAGPSGVDWRQGRDLCPHVGMRLAEESYNEVGLTAYNRKRFFASGPVPVLDVTLPEGKWRICVAVQTVVTHHKYWGHFPDALNPAAVRRFIELTHERYRGRFGAEFGRVIHSIFVDETAPGWSERIPEAFRVEHGYDLLPNLPVLQEATHPEHARVRHDLERTQYRLFCESFEEQIAGWCRGHGLRYSGEKPSWRLAQLKYMDIPGCEPGHTKAGAPQPDWLRPYLRQNARAAASAAYFYGKEGALCECYHSLGWSGTLLDARLIAEGLLLMGIRYLVPHGFFYTTHALAKHDAPPTFFFQMPYWPRFGRLSARLGRLTRAFEGTWIDAGVLVVDPSPGVPTQADREDYARLLIALAGARIEFMIADTDVLQGGRIEGDAVRIKDLTIRAVVVPPMRVVEPPLAAWLSEFERAGGLVIRGGSAPATDAGLAELTRRVPPRLRIAAVPDDGRLFCVARTDGRRRLWLLLNTGRDPVDAAFGAASPLKEIPLDDLPSMLQRREQRWSRTIRPFESVLLEEDPAAAAPSPTPPVLRLAVGGAARVRLMHDNLLRMYTWTMHLLNDAGPEQAAAVSAMPIIDQLERGGFTFAPHIRHYFGWAPDLKLPRLRVRYEFAFENRYAGPVRLVMEPDSLRGDWSLRVNDAAPLVAADFVPVASHVRGSLGCDITGRLRPGANTLAIDLSTDRMDGGLRNALYLAGDFGVATEGPCLIERPAAGRFEDYSANGIPFFSGVLEYEMTVDAGPSPADGAIVEMDFARPFEDACDASFNGGPWHPMPWAPYLCRPAHGELRPGRNSMRLRVYTTLIRAFEGQWFDIERHATRDVADCSAR